MNAKEEIIRLLKEQLDQLEMQMPGKYRQVNKLRQLIAATKAAIFDVPSQEEISNISNDFKVGIGITASKCFEKGINFILNYKKPEPDGKAHLD
jgi:hypothetical protein